ncbi:MAG: rsmG [Herminiimonas sp.]|nr:rsmG [Herminiimonas sp.]MDB5852221.1 rsmG [Herminiimonas sp.]
MKGFDRPALSDALRRGLDESPKQGSAMPRLSEMQLGLLIDFLALLHKWNAVYNLTAIRDPAQMVVQHLLDSLAVAPAFEAGRNVLDVGSGGGLPGLVLAIWAIEANPDMQISLIDTVHKKTAFLTQAKAELGLRKVHVFTGRVEELAVPDAYDIITSRAFADLSDFVSWSGHLLAPNGRFLAMKGVAPTAEAQRLPAPWRVSGVLPVHVPGLHAERHLVVIERAAPEHLT